MVKNNILKSLNLHPKYLSSAHSYKDFPSHNKIEYCIIGRSNVGKSSFINHLFGNNKLARVSKTPGKTILANFFQVNDSIVWVDLPGYGYAKKSKTEKTRISKLISDYCERRDNLSGIIWLIDIRHSGTYADIEAYNWFCTLGLPLLPVFTKCDKLSQSNCEKQAQTISNLFNFRFPPVKYSIKKQSSREKFREEFIKWHESISKRNIS